MSVAIAPAHARPPAVALAGVTADYRGRDALHDVTLEIAPGERVALVGPNGAGKSTLLRVASGLLRPRLGAARLAGGAVDRLDRLAVARRLAVVPATGPLPFAMTVEEVVSLGRLPWEDPFRGQGADDRAAVARAIERVGLGGLVGRDARELSAGERQLVLVALALAQETPILVLDEPTAHLDLRHQVEVMELVRDLNERDGTTILAVLHDLSLAAHFFPRLVLLDRGQLVADGPPSEVLRAERLRAVFGVDPALVRV